MSAQLFCLLFALLLPLIIDCLLRARRRALLRTNAALERIREEILASLPRPHLSTPEQWSCVSYTEFVNHDPDLLSANTGCHPPIFADVFTPPIALDDRLFLGRFRTTTKPILAQHNNLVVRAWDRTRNAPVVLKLPRVQLDDRVYLLRRAERERTCLRNANAFAPQLVAAYLINGLYPCVVMSLVPGEPLSDWLGQLARIRPEQRIELAYHIALAVTYFHERLHTPLLDLKPANIMVDLDASDPTRPLVVSVHLIDFDHSRFGRLATDLTGQGFGTLGYRGPETLAQCVRHPALADQFSLGAIFYELATGRWFLDDQRFVEDEILTVAHWREIDRGLGRIPNQAFANIIRRLLAANPTDRYPSVAHVAAHLKLLRHV